MGTSFFVFQGVWVFFDKCNAGFSTNLNVYYSTLGVFFHEQISQKVSSFLYVVGKSNCVMRCSTAVE